MNNSRKLGRRSGNLRRGTEHSGRRGKHAMPVVRTVHAAIGETIEIHWARRIPDPGDPTKYLTETIIDRHTAPPPDVWVARRTKDPMSETGTETPAAAQPGPETVVQAMHRIFTATLIIGVPGAGKTTLFKGFAEYLWETYGKVLLLYSWDGGAIPTDVQKRMKQGLIRFWRARTRSGNGLSLETMYLASKGYWPARINAETGETSPAVKLVAPITTTYHVTCSKGHPLMTVPAISLVVPPTARPARRSPPTPTCWSPRSPSAPRASSWSAASASTGSPPWAMSCSITWTSSAGKG